MQLAASRLAHGKAVNDYPVGTQAVNTEHSLHLQAVALWLLAALLSIVGLLVAGQLLARLSYLESVDYRTLQALGMSRRQLLATGLGRAVVIGVAGAVIALVVATALSPLLPVGLAGIAEPHPGVDVDWLVLGPGLIAVVLAILACAAWSAWRAAATALAPSTALSAMAGSGGARPGAALSGSGRPARPLSLVTAAIGSVTAAMGIRLALTRGAGRTALPVRSTIAGAAIGVAALSGATVFAASLGHLLATPALYGVTWDADVSNLQNGLLTAALQSVGHDRSVSAWSSAYVGVPLEIRGTPVDAIAMSQGRSVGSFLPVLVEGRLPRRADEVVLGERTLAAIHARVGARSACR